MKPFGDPFSSDSRLLQETIPWIERVPGAPYFVTEDGKPWTPIGQNDAITWPDLKNLFLRKDVAQVEGHLKWLKSHGVNVLRLMLEYSQTNHRYLERPVGKFQPHMVQLWDDLFFLCEKHELRILLTPMDTFWMWLKWKNHPYNIKNGGPCSIRRELLLSRNTVEAIKNRFSFAIQRWGGSGVLFGWDLWNEIHPAHFAGKSQYIFPFITEISEHVRTLENNLYGRSHLQTVSVFGPLLYQNPEVASAIFRHPKLDFASSHFYDSATINNPKNTVDPAVVTGRLVREALEQIKDQRPFLDTEHGPIHSFKDRKRTLPEAFDDEYFKHMQWAHMASGGAGGGMRWPNRNPHVLTHGMRREQKILKKFSGLVEWKTFRRKNLNQEVKISNPGFAVFSCGDDDQVILYLLRTDQMRKKQVDRKAKPVDIEVGIPGMSTGRFKILEFNTSEGTVVNTTEKYFFEDQIIHIPLKGIISDIAVVLQKHQD